MYIAMNRFPIKSGEEETFESIWRERETYLEQVPGFRSFHLLRGPETDDHTLYISHSVWENHEAFQAWTRSEAFRKAHANAGAAPRDIYLGPPKFEGFVSVLTQSV